MRITPDTIRAAVTADVWPPVLAVDPGGTSTGICLRAGTEAVMATTWVRSDQEFPANDPGGFVRAAEAALDAADDLIRHSAMMLTRLAKKRDAEPGGLRWAVEGLVAPAPHRAKGNRISFKASDFRTLGPAGILLGLLVGRHPDAIIVPPAGRTGFKELTGWDNLGPAKGPDSPYPDGLRGLTPTAWPRYAGAVGKQGARSHQRSAWGIAGAAHLLAPETDTTAPVATYVAPSPEDERRALVPLIRTLLPEAKRWEAWDAAPGRVLEEAEALGLSLTPQDSEFVLARLLTLAGKAA